MKEKFISIKKERILKRFKLVIQKQISYLPATYRQKSIDQLVDMVYQRFMEIGFMSCQNDDVIFYPVVAKLTGEFEEGQS